MPLRILSDFDGVFTEPSAEAGRVREHFRDALVRLTRLGPDGVDRLFEAADREIAARPGKHGWIESGRITAFADEDLFIRNNALAAIFDAEAEGTGPGVAHAAGIDPAELARALEGLRAEGFPAFTGVAQWAFVETTRETREGKHDPMEPDSARALRGWVEAGHDVVVVSNSGTDRVLDLLARSGVDAANDEWGGAGTRAAGHVRVRGGARKFQLGATPAALAAAGREMDVSRPTYEKILREERPDAVIGDVFSLDLALPLHLARSEPAAFPGLRLYLRARHYTPAWSREWFAAGGEGTARVAAIESLDRVCG